MPASRPAYAAEIPLRRFAVYGVEDASSGVHLVEGVDFDDAALLFAEDRHAESDAEEMSLVVEDCATGERQCFRIELAGGGPGPSEEV